MTIGIAFAVAAGIGTVIRWWCSRWNRMGRPIGTLAVNTVAAFALGMLAGAAHDTMLVVGVAHLGSLSTFSTVVKEVSGELQAGRTRAVAGYVATTVVLGVSAAWLGLTIS